MSDYFANLKARTQRFALAIIGLSQTLPHNRISEVIGRQLLRAGTSVGANYRAACRAKSPADFISKMGIVEEELDESMYWMELLVAGTVIPESRTTSAMREANELLGITIASIRTARRRPTAS